MAYLEKYKRKLQDDEEDDTRENDLECYIDDVGKSEGTSFRVVKVLMATAHGIEACSHYITFEAEMNIEGSVTFQTQVIDYNTRLPKFEILFVRIKSDHKKSKNYQPPGIYHNASVVEDRGSLSQVINKYTIDTGLDSRYSLALYLSQYALVCHDFHVLSRFVAKHDVESLKVLKLVKPDSEDPTYMITFKAAVHAETEKKSVETFEAKICMPTLFPKTTIELRSEARVVTA